MGLKHVLFVTSGLSGTGIIDECKTNFENAGVSVSVYDKVESNPKDYNVMDAYKAFSRRRVRRVRLHRRRSHRTTRPRALGSSAAHDGQERQRVPGRERLRDAGQPGAHRDQHDRGDGFGDDAGLRHHRPFVAGRAAQVGRFRPGGDHDAGDQRPGVVHDAAAGVRGVHGLRHVGPRFGVLRRAGAAPLDYADSPRRDQADPGEPARGDLQPEELQGDGGDGLGAVHGCPGVLAPASSASCTRSRTRSAPTTTSTTA